jgi:hypothetical protein
MVNGHRYSSHPSSMGGLRTGMPSQSKLSKLELDDWRAIATRAPLETAIRKGTARVWSRFPERPMILLWSDIQRGWSRSRTGGSDGIQCVKYASSEG